MLYVAVLFSALFLSLYALQSTVPVSMKRIVYEKFSQTQTFNDRKRKQQTSHSIPIELNRTHKAVLIIYYDTPMLCQIMSR